MHLGIYFRTFSDVFDTIIGGVRDNNDQKTHIKKPTYHDT